MPRLNLFAGLTFMVGAIALWRGYSVGQLIAVVGLSALSWTIAGAIQGNPR